MKYELLATIMIKILAIEDNPIHQEFLYIVTEELGYQLVGIADNAKDGLELLFSFNPDIILMDIEIHGKDDGIALADKINRLKPCPIIFTTAITNRETFDKAKNTAPYAYLIKPFTKEDLQTALELAIYRYAIDEQRKKSNEQIIPDWSEGIAFQKYLFIKRGSMIDKVEFDDILVVEVAKDRYCSIITQKDEYLVRSSLKDIGSKLPLKDYVQIHRSTIVRVNAIEQVDSAGTYLVINNKNITIGKTYREKILKHLNLL